MHAARAVELSRGRGQAVCRTCGWMLSPTLHHIAAAQAAAHQEGTTKP